MAIINTTITPLPWVQDEKMKKKYLWWGKHLTQMQMAQFFFNFVQVRPRTV